MKIVRNEGENRLRFAGDRRPDFALVRNKGDRRLRFAGDRRPDFELFSQKLKMHFSWLLKQLQRFGA